MIRLQIQLKLSVVMGLPWIFEPISWVVDSSAAFPDSCWIWLATDLVNMLQGVFILLIFVAKRAVLRRLAIRMGIIMSQQQRGMKKKDDPNNILRTFELKHRDGGFPAAKVTGKN